MIDLETREEIKLAVHEAFGETAGTGRYVDVTRIPLICQSIKNIDTKLEQLVTKEAFWPVKTLVYGITALMLSGIVGALLMLVIRKNI